MECIRVQPEVDVVEYVTRVWQVFLSLCFGIFVGVCVTVIVFVCWYKVFDKVSHQFQFQPTMQLDYI